jgi:diguanylate cyclase (GGDEF)-like protein/PAS domain S-box-containing protein
LSNPVQPILADQSTRNHRLWQTLVYDFSLGGISFFAALLGLSLLAHPQRIPVLWLPSGILISILLIKPRREWLPLFLTLTAANFLACLITDFPIGTAIGYTFTYMIEGLLAVLVLQRIIGQQVQPFRLKQMGIALVIASGALSLTALLGATIAFLSFNVPFWSAWLTWALADGMGALLLVPIILAWSLERPVLRQINRSLIIEGIVVMALLLTVTWMVFFSTPKASGFLLTMPLVVYPFLFWAAFRLGTVGAASTSSLLALITFWSAALGYGPFSTIETTFESRIIAVQAYLITSTLFAWMVVALINERKTAERAWQSSEKHLRSILQNAPVFIGQIDAHAMLAFNNWLISENHQEFDLFAPLIPDHASLLREAIQMIRITGKPWQAEVAAQEGDVRQWFDVQLSPILADGRVESIILTANDISKRKNAEEALRESEERFSGAVRGANDGIWDWDLAQNKIYFSSRWKKMLGYSENEIGDSPDEWLGRIHPDDTQQVRSDLNAHLEGYTPHFVSEHRIMNGHGAYRWVLVRGLAVRSPGKHAHRLAGSLTDITARKTTEERLLHDAMHDVLTGLPNRAYFLDQLKRSIQRLKRHSDYWNAVLFIDLDRFKLVNESFGHAAGDQLLIETARRLENSLRPQDTVARFGGDEFAILLDDIKVEEDAIRVADRVQAAMSQPFYPVNQEVFTSASIGIVVNVGNYERAEDLLRDADTALYEAKANGRGRHQTFDSNMRMRNLALLQLETDLRRALERQEFEVYYQPIISLPSNTITSLEALIRWHHPERGLILPNDFIPRAEENGLIVPINDWVIRTACCQLKKWLVVNPNLRMSVNLSGRQLQNPNLAAQFRQILVETGIEGRNLQLEVTESAAMQDFDLTIKILTEVSEMGILISLDDFLMRYSSLDYLKLPVNTIKIDKSFIWDLPEDGEDAAITRTIISMGHLLNKIVVAEGVETPRQLDFLHQHQCDEVQGFLYSEPRNCTIITTLLENGLNLSPLVPHFPDDIIP